MKQRAAGVLLALLSLLLTGCYALDRDNFYAPPRRSAEYQELQEAVEQAMDGGTYAAPVIGTNRQAIQRVDLDGDGAEEILVFCKREGDHPLRVLVLRQQDERWELLCTLEGDGSAFDSVQYAQIDGEPGLEILLSRRLGEQVQQFLSVYTLKDGVAAELMSSPYAAYTTTDLDADGLTDIFVLRSTSVGPNADAELYRFRDGELSKGAEANLSTTAENVKRILTGRVAEGVSAVLVASAFDENHLITDVFALENDHFSNISLNDESGQSSQTVRNYYVYSTDIDGDGLIEMPNTVGLPPLEGDERSEGQFRIVWYNLSVDGTRTDKLNTYHSYAEGWYFYLPEAWCETLRVTRMPAFGGAGTRFFRMEEDGTATLLLTIYTRTGEPPETAVILAQKADLTYYAEPGEGLTLSDEELQNRFSFIAADLLPDGQ